MGDFGETADPSASPISLARDGFGRDDRVWSRVPEFPSQPCLFAVELAESGEVLVVVDLELAGLEQEEGGDEVWVAADDAELAAELLPRVTPLPPPVREAAVETVSNHEDMGCSEHQIRLSKGVIAKFVQPLNLAGAYWRAEFRRQNEKPPQWWLFVLCLL